MNTHLFIKTYHRDYCWLDFCLASVRRNLTGYSGITILTDPGQLGDLEEIAAKHLIGIDVPVHCDTFPNPDDVRGYMWQQVAKLHADEHVPADTDFIAIFDSDCVFHQGTTVSQWFSDVDDTGTKAHWGCTPYSELGSTVPWKAPTEKWLGAPVADEFMRGHPFVIPFAAFAHVREHTIRTHGRTIDQYIAATDTFSEFNAIGAWIEHDMAAGGVWPVRFVTAPGPPRGLTQRWSWGGMNRQTIDEIKNESGI